VVADAIKEFSIRAVDGSELTAEGFKDIGLNAEEMSAAIAKGGPEANDALDQTLDRLRDIEDPVKRSQAAVKLFGTQAEDLGDALFALDLDTAAQGLGNIEGAASKMGATLADNASTKIESFKRKALGGLTSFIGNDVIPGVENLVATFQEGGLGAVLDDVGEGLQAALPHIKEALGEAGSALLGFLKEQGPVALDALGGFLADVANWVASEGLPKLGELMKELVPGLISWLVDDAIPKLVEELPGILKALGDWIIQDGAPALLGFGQDLGEALLDGIGELLSAAGGAAADIGKAIGNGIIDFVNSNVIDRINGVLEFTIDPPGPGPKLTINPPDIPHIPTFRADGGPVNAGEPYIVGERRPELFVPSTSGTILPSVPSGFGGQTFVQNIYNPLPEQPSDSVRALRRVALEVA
jgi:hypothetical protein